MTSLGRICCAEEQRPLRRGAVFPPQLRVGVFAADVKAWALSPPRVGVVWAVLYWTPTLHQPANVNTLELNHSHITAVRLEEARY